MENVNARSKPLPVSPLRFDRPVEVTRLPDGRLDGRSPGSQLTVRRSAFPGYSPVAILDDELAAYSCGYSHGIG